MNKQQAEAMGEEVMAAAKAIAAKYGMEVKRGSGRFSESEFKLNNITFFQKGEIGSRYSSSDEDSMKVHFDFYKHLHGLDSVNVGDVYFDSAHNSDMKIVGWKKANRKYPVLCQCLNNGKMFKMNAASLKLSMELG